MSNFINKVYKNNTIVYKVLLFLIAVVSIVYLFPKGGQFKYDFNKGKPWQYDNLYATFDFSIQKSDEEINIEKRLTVELARVKNFSRSGHGSVG